MPRAKSKYIKIEEPKILKNRLLLSKISCSRNIEKYFQQELFSVEYDSDIKNVSASILQIPVFSNIITVAWTICADVYVKELDRSYLGSLKKIKSVMKRWYPKLPFSTEIHVGNIVSNKFSYGKYGLLFSGGVDSTASYIRHKNQNPNLIMVRGADIPLAEEKFWRKVKDKYKDFARQENVEINSIETNTHQFINEGLLGIEFGRYLTDFSWWGGFTHGITLLGLSAPLTVVKRIGTMLIAATFTKEFKYPWGSHPLVDNKLSWGDLKVIHDGYELSRQKKIRYVLKNYSRRYPLLRACWIQFHDLNCSKCEKCCRTITSLVLENIDPNECGFNVDSGFFYFLKGKFISDRERFGQNEDEVYMWKDIQKHIPESLEHNLYNSKRFFRWFKDFDVSGNAKKRKIDRWWCLPYVYNKLPKNVQKVLS